MSTRLGLCAAAAWAVGAWLVGCASPLDRPAVGWAERVSPGRAQGLADRFDGRVWMADGVPGAVPSGDADMPALPAGADPFGYVRLALERSPQVAAAYQRWRAAVERTGQAGAWPDPRLGVGFFLEPVQTRTGPQRARVGVSQSLPWPGVLDDRKDAAERAASAAWRRYEAQVLDVAQGVLTTLYELAYLDAALANTGQSLELLRSFEALLLAEYRVGRADHRTLVRVQVEIGQLDDRLERLRAMRRSLAAELNAALDLPPDAAVPVVGALPGQVVAVGPEALVAIALENNPALQALDAQAHEQRALAQAARGEGLPEVTVGVETIITDHAADRTVPGSGDDPILLSVGVRLPIWRTKYDASVREAMARRLAFTQERAGLGNRIAAGIHRAWLEHTDAHRRLELYGRTLIPKAREAVRVALERFRAGKGDLLDVLDTQRTLLELAIAGERARSDRGQALARLHALVGRVVPTVQAEPASGRIDDRDQGGNDAPSRAGGDGMDKDEVRP
ncbi:MAG: hypothetical protein KatS3mg103_1370 [Phycisphaerales bacterium]|nr:MAG: hypothetical protein KatS3mg103_1370 [Phycisphaerales bacterium]